MVSGLTWCFAGLAWWCSGYFKVSGIGAPMSLASLVEQDYANRLATARLVRPRAGTSSAFVDLFFANSGIEDEIVRRADRLEVLPGVFMAVASVGHLIALKVLAGRHQDMTDLGYLISAASEADLDEARERR